MFYESLRFDFILVSFFRLGGGLFVKLILLNWIFFFRVVKCLNNGVSFLVG